MNRAAAQAALAHRLKQSWRSKLLLSVVLPAAFCACYFPLQRYPLFPARSFSPSWLDEHTVFDARWVYVYQSLYLLTPLPWLASSIDELRRYVSGFVLLCAAGFLAFLLVPVATPRPAGDAAGLYGLLVRYDAPLNSFPSLHVGLATYTLLFGVRILGRRAWLELVLLAWVCAIAYATLVIKQHLAIDLPPALLLAWAADRWAWRSMRKDIAMRSSSTRSWSYPVAFAVLLGIGVPAHATEEEDRQALRQLKTLYEQAVNEDKLDLLAPHLDAAFTGIMLTSEPVVGLEGMKAYWRKMKDLMGSAGSYRVSVSYEPAQFYGDIATARGTTSDVVTMPGKEFRFASHWTATCRKQDGAWKILRIHASMDPLGNPFVTSWLQAARGLFGAGGAAAGLLVGGGLGVVLGRRRAARA